MDRAGAPNTGLVGRAREQELLRRLISGAAAGSPAFVFVCGEPGIGKTRLLADLEREADAAGCVVLAGSAGCVVLAGSAAEFERELPFGVFVDAVDESLESPDPQTFSR